MLESAMGSRDILLRGTETKLFDPQDDPAGKDTEVLDASVVRRGDPWWMCLAGQSGGYGATQLFSASLEPGAALSAAGWKLSRDNACDLTPLAGQSASRAWDGNGGRHCPSYAKGWDPHKREWVERIYYAGAAENLWGPYTIGFLEWNGEEWVDQRTPAFAANEEWEHSSVFEPNLIHHDGKWKMWYVAGSNHENYLVQGYAESDDGVTGWNKHTIFAPPEMGCSISASASELVRSMLSSRAFGWGKAAHRPRLVCGGAAPRLQREFCPTGAIRSRS
jgi:hypothetical protein